MTRSLNKKKTHQLEEPARGVADGRKDEEMPIETLKSQKNLEKTPDRMAKARAAKLNQPKKAHKKGQDMRDNPKVLARSEQMPEIYRANYRRAMGCRSPAAGIKAFCLECVGWQREEVKLCTSPACPLFPYRPYKD